MSAGMPELGSKISLISKADIRYEGRLFTVDPQECTIALANVKSFGTEERETQFPVAPQNQVYEYILFRGSDIKDIRVVTNVSSMPNDPAIVQMTVQPSIGQPTFQPQPGFGHPIMSQINAISGQYGSPYGMSVGGIGQMMSISALQNRQSMCKQSELSIGTTVEPRATAIPNLHTTDVDQSLEDGVLDILSVGSRSVTPTSALRKSPTIDQGVQVGQQQSQSINIGKIGDKQNLRSVQVPFRDRDSLGIGRASGISQYSEGKPREYKDSSMMNQNVRNRGVITVGNQSAGWMNRSGHVRGHRNGLTGHNVPRGRGGTHRSQQPLGPRPKNTLKFENDYDFEQANTEFEELRSQLAKTKIDTGSENEKKDDSGNETGAGDNEPEEESEIVHYDKTKSFFDNISCEAVERSKGRSQRTDWRTERKLNSETFGVASMRRGHFRGGRGYYNRGMGNSMYRNNLVANNQNFRTGYRGQRSGGQRKVLINPNQQFMGNSQSNTGLARSDQSSHNNPIISNRASTEKESNNPSGLASTNQNQQNSHLVTSSA